MKFGKPVVEKAVLAFESYGVRISIAFSPPSLRDSIVDRLPPGWLPIERDDLRRLYQIEATEGDAETWKLSIDDGEPRPFADIDELLDELEGDIQIFVAEFATPHLFVHAGVVAWHGRAILLPGRSFAGKSTLVTSLVKAGATYYSDEYAVLDAEGLVLPYPRRVSLRTGPHGPTGRLDLSQHMPQGSAATQPIPVCLVALLRYAPESGWAVETLSSIRGIMAISEQTVAIQRRPADTLAILAKVAESAQVIQGTRGEVDEAVQRLLALDTILGWRE